MTDKALIHQIEARERRGRWFPALAGLLTIALLASTWIGLFAFLGTNAAYGTFTDLEDEYIPDVESMALSFPDLSQVSRVYASGGELLAELHDGRVSEPVPFEEIPQRVVDAILAAEDKDFYEHDGVNFQAIASAALDNLLFDQTRGGSTITQQVVKNNFVGDELTIRRKITEAFVAAEVERRFSKDEILEFYLNSVYFGSGAYGIKAAAREFYGKALSQLTVSEAATLSVLVRNPSLYNPRRFPDNVLDRRDDVIDEMLQSGWITQLERDREVKKPLGVIDHTPFKSESDHVVAEVRRQLLDLEREEFDFLGTTKEERKRSVFGCPADDTACRGGGGLTIRTTIDLPMQKAANAILGQWLPFPDPEANLALCERLAGPLRLDTEEKIKEYAAIHSCSPTGAIATVENLTGRVIVMASGLPFDQSQFDLAVQGKRNPGSSMKPFTLVAALENEVTLGSYYNGASPIDIQCGSPCSSLGNIWRVSNAGGGGYGYISLEQATSSSVNTVYAQVSQQIGPDKIVEVAHRMGVESELRPTLSLTLGTSEVSPLEMASAYSNFATNGLHAHTYLISEITDRTGEKIYSHQLQQDQVGNPAIFAAARRPLTKVPTSAGTAPRANIGVPQGGKTGTHQDYRDAWYVGFTPTYSTAVWVGYEADQIPLTNLTINGEQYARVFGGSVPAPIWASFMTTLLEGKDPGVFPENPPGTEEFFKTPVSIVPTFVGLTVEQARQLAIESRVLIQVVEVPSLEPVGIVVSQSAEAGATIPQGVPVSIGVSTGVPPVGALPAVVGLPFDQAVAALQAFSEETYVQLTILRQDAPTADPAKKGTILAMNPPPGTQVGSGIQVVLTVGV
jgi:membrane peptidoglycan carboxypeptidase